MPGPAIQASSCRATRWWALAVVGSRAITHSSLLSAERATMTARVPSSDQSGSEQATSRSAGLVSDLVAESVCLDSWELDCVCAACSPPGDEALPVPAWRTG